MSDSGPSKPQPSSITPISPGAAASMSSGARCAGVVASTGGRASPVAGLRVSIISDISLESTLPERKTVPALPAGGELTSARMSYG
jgi:hypothetical protein